MERSAADYLAPRQCARQWQTFLTVFAAELSEQLSQDALRLLFYRTGTRYAAAHPLPDATSVADMQQAMADIWDAYDWGTVSLSEVEAALQITHVCSPLMAAFGESAQAWTPAFLEGAYQQWFTQLGSSELLRVKQVSDADEFGTITFKLARH